ncbi:hypothetical protein HY065_02500, partial [Candidatus Berkelbacteria bacterium]|nr:hypothetical protein [Candidatus Berkelbacteria bacterium]
RRFSTLLVGAVALALILILSIGVQKNRSTGVRRAQDQRDKLIAAKKEAEEGKTALIFGQQAQAAQLFAQAVADARFAATNPKLAQEANTILNDTNSQLDKLTQTTRLANLKPLAQVGSLTGITNVDNTIWGFNDSANLVSVNLIDGTVAQAASAPKQARVIAATPSDTNLLGLTADHQLLQANLKDKTITILSPTDNAKLTDGNSIKTFSNNLYVLNASANQIWRHQLKNDGYGPAVPFFKTKPNLGSARAMAIDGAVYVLTDDGKLTKYLKGEKQDFTLTGLPKPDDTIAAPLSVFADSEALSIFLVDNQKNHPRLVEFSKDGKYMHQYAIELPSLDDAFITSRGRKAWLISGGKLYEVNL